MMNMRVLRVLRAHKLRPIFNVSRSWSRSRTISISLPRRLDASKEPLSSPASASGSAVENLKEVQEPIEEEPKSLEEAVSKIHWALDEGYEAGGRLKSGGKDQLNRFDEKGLPRWGNWGIDIKLQARGGTSVLSLSVALPSLSKLSSQV
jgi:hypothetical protein